MSLAFDKQGKPFTFLRRARKLLVRLFRNPSARGTCCQVLAADGEPLYVDIETDYAEFRRAIGHVPGLYRLDQCDEDGNELDDAQPAYVSVDVARNAAGGDVSITGEVNPLVIIQQMAAVQADVMKTLAAQQAPLMAAAAEIMRAPYRPAPAVPAELRNADTAGKHDDEDEDEDDDEPEEVPEHPATAALRMLEPYLPALGAFLYEKVGEFLRQMYSKKATTPAPGEVPASATAPAPMPVPTPATVATARAPVPAGFATVAAAGSSPMRPVAPIEPTPVAPRARVRCDPSRRSSRRRSRRRRSRPRTTPARPTTRRGRTTRRPRTRR